MDMKYEIKIDENLCVGCGNCADDCVALNIEICDGKAKLKGLGCIFCGHCEAICPTDAVTMTGFDDEAVPMEKPLPLEPKALMDAIKTRRSIRQFKDQPIPEEVLADIIEAGRLAPTGGNAQMTHFVVVKDKMAELEAVAVESFRAFAKEQAATYKFLSPDAIDDHFFFKGAPVAIVICGFSKTDACLAAENMAFMAEAHGLGVLFSGFYTECANTVPAIKEDFNLPEGMIAGTTIVLGWPAVKYNKTARRQNAKVIWR